ncbi:ABC transporter ATP-binding protein [Paenibacillus sp. CCS19]|uniref:ribosomal protection-like ABC-F family protein n=1 Tax=Paenibacillus sp. CCS19 TaxID=3158387 RepID=UPI00256BFF62|nr:ABC-F type ribosomal protection protein [Paenibacillus cellulosilyticus]GMK38288.1 ABC transporter ATP-binding protein [Paenibacillus cellulosilyticus]
MTTIISVRNLKKSFGDHTVLSGINFDIAEGERIGLVGMNGAGKTTLANLLFGGLQPDSGMIRAHRSNLNIGYLLQSTSYTVHTFAGMGAMSGDQDGHSDTERFLELTSQLGLSKVRHWDENRFDGLSGGEKTKLAIADIWASKPDVLLLDEPTNHLDLQGVEWLIDELAKFEGTVIVISHDRHFLDRATKRTIEIDEGALTNYPGNYTYYREEKARRYASQLHHYIEQTKYERKIHEEINRLKQWSDKAHREAGKVGKMAEMRGVKEFYRTKAKKMDQQIKSRIHRLEKIDLEGVKKPKEEAEVRFEWDQPAKRGRRIIEALQLRKSFGERTLFDDSSFFVQRGERIGLLGPNGCGKTTLLRMMTGQETADAGRMWVSPAASIAYLTQDVSDLKPNQTVVAMIEDAFPNREQQSEVRTMLANMGLDESVLRRSIGDLSLGERTRVKLARLIMQEHDVLILDEPTNHLDLPSREQLEQALVDYDGTLLVVSHDRYFVERICDKLLVFNNGTISKQESGLKEYTEKLAQNEPDDTKAAPSSSASASASASASTGSTSAMSKEERKEQLMLLDNQIAYVLGELAKHVQGDSRYAELDAEFRELAARKRELQQK